MSIPSDSTIVETEDGRNRSGQSAEHPDSIFKGHPALDGMGEIV
jgi:hypothetical protein